MDCEWKEMRNLRRSSLTFAGRSYSGVFAKERGLEGREKGISGPFEELPVDNATEEEWRKQWGKLLLKSHLWIPEPVEVAVGEGGKFLCRFNPNLYSKPKKEEFVTSLGRFVSHDNGEFGGEMILPDGESIIGNFCEVVECGGAVYAIDSCSHMGMGHINVYAFDESLSPQLLYGHGMIDAMLGGLLSVLSDDDSSQGNNPTSEWLSFNTLCQADGSLYVISSGQTRSSKDTKWKDKSKLLQFKEGRLLQTIDFPGALPHAYSMAVHDGKLLLGFDKVAAVIEPGGMPIEVYALIDREAEEEILRNGRK